MEPKSKQDAKRDGDTYYFTGKPCLRGHVSIRYVSSGNCLDCEKLRDKRRYPKERENRIALAKRWAEENPERKKATVREYQQRTQQRWTDRNRERYQNDKVYRMKRSMRGLVRNTYLAFSAKRNDRTHLILGYSAVELIAHLEQKFQEGMSWDNYGDWHIDHIKPIQAFVDEGNFNPREINALSNLQPLWAEDNLSKGAKYGG